MKLPSVRKNLIQYIGAFFLVFGVGYLLFLFIDTQRLPPLETETVIVSRAYRPLSHGTYTTKVGNSFQTFPLIIPEAWVITVSIGGEPASGEVPQDEYKALKEGDSVHVVYTQKRIRRSLAVQEIYKLNP